MAITLETITPPVLKLEERTWRVTLFCDAKTPQAQWRVEFNRGTIKRDPEGNTFGDENQAVATVHRTFGQIATQSVPGGPRTVTTYADLMQLVADCGDAFRQEDLVPVEPEPEPEPEEQE